MYTSPQKRFRARAEAEVHESIRKCGAQFGAQVRRVFLADGDAMMLPTRRLLSVLQSIRQHLPAVRRVSSYCLPRNLRKKTVAELALDYWLKWNCLVKFCYVKQKDNPSEFNAQFVFGF